MSSETQKSELSLTVLGSGVALATQKRGCPGYLLRHGKERILLDMGSGTIRQLAHQNCPFQTITHIFLTHPHLDHCGDLPPFLFARRNPDLKDLAYLEIFGWPGFMTHYDKLYETYGRWVRDKRGRLSLVELCEGRHEWPKFTVEALHMEHMPEALGFRFEFPNGRVVAYSGDTDMCDAVIELGRNADLFILECSFPDELKVKGHLTPSECGQIAAKAQCKQLLLSHFYPSCEGHDIRASCQKHWDGDIIIAEDGLHIPLA